MTSLLFRIRRTAMCTWVLCCLAASALLACDSGHDECNSYDARCDGNIAMNCRKSGDDLEWDERDCGSATCDTYTERSPDGGDDVTGAVCVDPTCHADLAFESFCEGTDLISCNHGERTGFGYCPGLCPQPVSTHCN
jgi:hypothetical protein